MKHGFPVTWTVLLALMVGITVGVIVNEDQKIDSSAYVFGSAHEHASISVMIHNIAVDFTQEQYQLQSPFIHLENNNGYVIHRHSQGVTLGYMFQTLNLELSKNCFILGEEKGFCTNDDYSLKFFINERQVGDIRDYLIFDGDYILISYGSETQEEIKKQLKDLKDRGFPFQLRERNASNLGNV